MGNGWFGLRGCAGGGGGKRDAEDMAGRGKKRDGLALLRGEWPLVCAGEERAPRQELAKNSSAVDSFVRAPVCSC